MTDQPQNVTIRIDPTWPYYYLWDHPLGDRLDITYWDTDSGISDTSAPNYADTDIVGRGELYKNWISTGNKELQITFQFHVQGVGTSALRNEVLLPARFLDALKHPVYDPGTDLSYAPPTVLVQIGSMFLIRAIVTQADIQWMAPFEPGTQLAHHAEVPTTFAVVRRNNADLSYRREAATSGRWR